MPLPRGAPRSSSLIVRALSVRQPHADCIIFGEKWCENRTWATPYRGEIFIHASGWDYAARRYWADQGFRLEELSPSGSVIRALLGRAELAACLTLDEVRAIERWVFGRRRTIAPTLQPLAERLKDVSESSWSHVSGPICWILLNPGPLVEPLPMRGYLNLWRTQLPGASYAFAPRPEPPFLSDVAS